MMRKLAARTNAPATESHKTTPSFFRLITSQLAWLVSPQCNENNIYPLIRIGAMEETWGCYAQCWAGSWSESSTSGCLFFRLWVRDRKWSFHLDS